MCGGFVLADTTPSGSHRLGLLPRILRLDVAANGLSRWLEPIFDLLRDKVEGSRPDTYAILAKLADVFLAQVLRNFLVGAEASGIMHPGVFTNPAAARAVELLHTFPARGPGPSLI